MIMPKKPFFQLTSTRLHSIAEHGKVLLKLQQAAAGIGEFFALLRHYLSRGVISKTRTRKFFLKLDNISGYILYLFLQAGPFLLE